MLVGKIPKRLDPTRNAIAGLLAAVSVFVMASPLAADEYSETIKPIFDKRCIACHSCYNAPCQLNLQSYSGAARGATSRNIYDAERLHSVPPTRLDIDAQTPAGWRAKTFHDVLGGGASGASLLLRLTRLRGEQASLQPSKQVAESQMCVADPQDPKIAENKAALGMPYGLPPLSSAELAALQVWIEHGAPGPASSDLRGREAIPDAMRGQVRTWELFFNEASPRQRLVSRYIYEHLFLASLYFADSAPSAAQTAPASQPMFFRLVRSRTACEGGIEEIATRRPTDAPGTPSMFYCLQPVMATVVEKKHIPYELSPGKLDRFRSLFLDSGWNVTQEQLYGDEQANNPFATFAEIPVKARYQFLLDDAQYHIATFIKGPVCNGTAAVDSIQEQFFVFFLNPDADSMVMLPEHARAAQNLLILPGEWGSDITVMQDLGFLKRLVDQREKYRTLRAESVQKLRPKGYGLDDIWDGDGSNPNALLTVFRHNDNAAVVKGAVGDLSKTAFVLDYPLFERLVYNLVVNFDVFGNVGHQVLTRVYMDLIRMEAEELFLSFLPPKERMQLRRDWYKGGLLTDVKLTLIFPPKNVSEPTAIEFHNVATSKLEFVQQVLFERLSDAARGPVDSINWRILHPPAGVLGNQRPSPADLSLRRIASIRAVTATPFARYFPDIAFVLVHLADGNRQIYSIVHNREHENVSWIMGDDLRMTPSEDTLTVKEGIFGAYPNMIFVVDEEQLNAFSEAAAAITSPADYDELVQQFGVPRTSNRIWNVYDEINAIAMRNQPIERGILDLSRYELNKN